MTYTIIKADLNRKRNDMIGLWRRNFQDVPDERYSWIYESNPQVLQLAGLQRRQKRTLLSEQLHYSRGGYSSMNPSCLLTSQSLKAGRDMWKRYLRRKKI